MDLKEMGIVDWIHLAQDKGPQIGYCDKGKYSIKGS
jgi:hypothetical protein